MLAGIPNINVYTVPDGYFDALLNDVLDAVTDKNLTKVTNNDLPAGYFEGLADNIMSRIKKEEDFGISEDSELLSFTRGINVYSVPEDYFNGLAENILLRTRLEENESSLLSAAHGINVYTVPMGYFDGLPNEILKKIPQPAKVVEMKRSFSVFRYAVAAVITGIIGLSVISVLNKRNIIQENLSTGTEMSMAKNIIKTNSFEQVLSTISDVDLVNYLEKSGEDVDAALVASVSDDRNLPDEVEYLTDDKTLDNLLNGLNLDRSHNN